MKDITREAIEYFKFYRKIFCEDHLKICPKDSIAYQATLKEKEFYEMAIKALEQEPCEDAISRQVALNAICKICAVETKPSECKYRKGLFGGCKEYEAIKAIPSAGHWIENLCDSCTNKACEFQSGILRSKCDFYIAPMPHLEPDNCGNYIVQQEPKTGHWIEKDGYDGDTYYDCSVCGESFCLIDGTPTDNLYKYCPNCGARMESEE